VDLRKVSVVSKLGQPKNGEPKAESGRLTQESVTFLKAQSNRYPPKNMPLLLVPNALERRQVSSSLPNQKPSLLKPQDTGR